jgi:hypothetical protein
MSVVNSSKDENEIKRTQLNNLMNTKSLQDTKINNLNTDVKITSNSLDELRRKNDLYVNEMERHMKIKLEVAARAVLNEERRCKEMKDQIIRLENTINELAGALKDARQIIVENRLTLIY